MKPLNPASRKSVKRLTLSYPVVGIAYFGKAKAINLKVILSWFAEYKLSPCAYEPRSDGRCPREIEFWESIPESLSDELSIYIGESLEAAEKRFEGASHCLIYVCGEAQSFSSL